MQVWRHSYNATYFWVDVDVPEAVHNVSASSNDMLQYAVWSPSSDRIVRILQWHAARRVAAKDAADDSSRPHADVGRLPSQAYVQENNIYIRNLAGTPERQPVTSDGSFDIVNGVPSWVYEGAARARSQRAAVPHGRGRRRRRRFLIVAVLALRAGVARTQRRSLAPTTPCGGRLTARAWRTSGTTSRRWRRSRTPSTTTTRTQRRSTSSTPRYAAFRR